MPTVESFAAHELVLGIDGGGSRTVALLASAAGTDAGMEKEIVGRGVAGSSNYQAVGRDRALAALDEAVEAAFDSAGVPRGQVAAACLGLAGADRQADREMLSEWAAQFPLATRLRFENDGALVLAAGTPACAGVALISGTGSIAVARAPDGRTGRAGGWGYLLGDEGSAYAIALAGLRAVTRAADGRGPATALTAAILSRLQIARPESLVPAIYGDPMDRRAVAGLADVVTAAAGDALAAGILQNAADELARAGVAAARNIGWDFRESVPLALAGGVLTGCPALREQVIEALRRQRMSPDPVRVVTDPALGAVRLARQIAG